MHKGTPCFQELVQGFRSIINLMAVQLSCDGLELESSFPALECVQGKKSWEGKYP